MACNCKIFCRFRLFFNGSILEYTKVELKNEDSFEAFNYYRSAAWKIRGVDNL